MTCTLYSPATKFKVFKVVEFPTTLVGLSSVKYLNLDVNLNTNAYIKTLFDGQLMKFEDARELSASHRAFEITIKDEHIIKMVFKPTIECIYKINTKVNIQDRFVVSIHLIEATKLRCCDNERHGEIGRYYICGLFEYCQIVHLPSTVDFGAVDINSKSTRIVKIRNDSQQVACKVIYSKIPEIQATPDKHVLQPKAIQTFNIVLKPNNLKVVNNIFLKIMSNYQVIGENTEDFIFYKIPLKYSTRYAPLYMKSPLIESLHKLQENKLTFTYTKSEFNYKIEQKEIALNLFEVSKLNTKRKSVTEKILPLNCYKYGCNKNISSEYNFIKNICKDNRKIIDLPELFKIILEPNIIQFDKIEVFSCDQQELKIKNKSKYDIILKFLMNDCITFTEKHLQSITLNLKSFSKMNISIYCLAFMEGTYNGTFEYTIENKFCMQHSYTITTANPTLNLKETFLRFGMTNLDNFITSVPISIYNNFNTNVEYEWEILDTVPFEVIPKNGCVSPRSSRNCSVKYNLRKATKTKFHEITLISCGPKKEFITVDINLFTKKHAICFLQNNIFIKDIPLNLEIIKIVELENISKEFAYFQVVEPLITGLTIYPMNGIIQPKTLIILKVTIKIPYTLSLSFELNIKINNKDTISLPVNGIVVAPELIIQPKNIHLQRIPSNLITYIPVNIKNVGTTISIITITKTMDMFEIYESITKFKQVSYLEIRPGETKIVYVKVFQKFRQEYDVYLPFIINDVFGPPKRENESSTNLQYYISKYEKYYDNNPKITTNKSNKEICFCRIAGVITLPWLQFSPDKYEFNKPNESIVFSMANISNHRLHITINMENLGLNYSLKLLSTDIIMGETKDLNIKFKMNSGTEAIFNLTFHPKETGTFISVAELYIDKNLTIPYYNLTFVGRNEVPILKPSTYKLVYPSALVGTKLSKTIELNMEGKHNLETFTYKLLNNNINVNMFDVIVLEKKNKMTTKVMTNVTINSDIVCNGISSIIFSHELGCNCEVLICYCFTLCPLTIHANSFVNDINQHPYPYYPSKEEIHMYQYMNDCFEFIENWLFVQGFKKEFYPVLPDSMYISSVNLSTQKNKTINLSISYLLFLRRIAGPLIKLIPKISLPDIDASYRNILEIHDTYDEIINLLKCRGADIWFIQAQYLLSYDQFVTYCENIPEAENCNLELRQLLLKSDELFYNLSKQCWIDFVLQSYKVFVLDNCFFDCVCENMKNHDVINIIIKWFNEQITLHENKLLKKNKVNFNKCITNITTDLSDGIAFAAAILNHCPFLEDHFSSFHEINKINREACLIHNTCLIIEGLNKIKINFPLKSTDLFQPNFLQMFFLGIHLYVVLPLFNSNEIIHFNPPLSINSIREITLYTATHEMVLYNYILLNNVNNAFSIDKSVAHANKKKNTFMVKFHANFIGEINTILILQGSNKTRLFDTYVVFYLKGYVGSLIPHKKVKLICPLYRSNKSDIMLTSPYNENAEYDIYIFDVEPTISTKIEYHNKPEFFVRRLNLIDKCIRLKGQPQGTGLQDIVEQKICVNVTCMSTRIENTWMWFKSDIGEFFIKVTIQANWDHALETLQVKLHSWPLDPCSCGERCECYRTTIVSIPERNDLMIKCLKSVLQESASEVMIKIFDDLIGTITGKEILRMLFEEGGTEMTEITHILSREIKCHISSKKLHPRLNSVTFTHPFDGILEVPVTIPANSTADKYTITITSDCGMDVRVYRLSFVEREIICDV